MPTLVCDAYTTIDMPKGLQKLPNLWVWS